MDLRLGTTVHRLDRQDGAIRATLHDGSTLVVDQVLVATGRRPNVAGLGLERVGLDLDAAGAIPVDRFLPDRRAVDPRPSATSPTAPP